MSIESIGAPGGEPTISSRPFRLFPWSRPEPGAYGPYTYGEVARLLPDLEMTPEDFGNLASRDAYKLAQQTGHAEHADITRRNEVQLLEDIAYAVSRGYMDPPAGFISVE